MNSDSLACELSDEQLACVTGGGFVNLNIVVVPQTMVADSTNAILFSSISHSNIGNINASSWLFIGQSMSTYK